MTLLAVVQQGRGVRVGVLVVVGVFELHVVVGRPEQVHAELLVVFAAVVVTGGDVVVTALLLLTRGRGELGNEGIGDGEVHQAFDLTGVVVAVASADLAVELARGLGALDVDDAADGVTSELRALRAAQHFDAADVEALQDGAGVGTDEHLIDHHAYCQVEALFDIGNTDARGYIAATPPGPCEVSSITRFGAMLSRSFRTRAKVRSISLWLSAVTAMATSWMFFSRFRAVTRMSARPPALSCA